MRSTRDNHACTVSGKTSTPTDWRSRFKTPQQYEDAKRHQRESRARNRGKRKERERELQPSLDFLRSMRRVRAARSCTPVFALSIRAHGFGLFLKTDQLIKAAQYLKLAIFKHYSHEMGRCPFEVPEVEWKIGVSMPRFHTKLMSTAA